MELILKSWISNGYAAILVLLARNQCCLLQQLRKIFATVEMMWLTSRSFKPPKMLMLTTLLWNYLMWVTMFCDSNLHYILTWSFFFVFFFLSWYSKYLLILNVYWVTVGMHCRESVLKLQSDTVHKSCLDSELILEVWQSSEVLGPTRSRGPQAF